MNKILVPVDKFSELSLTAAHYALEFAKRSDSKPLFLFFTGTESANPARLRTDCSPGDKKESEIRKKIALLFDQSAMNGLAVEQYECHGEYIEKVCEFVRDFNITAIVIALPDKEDRLYDKIKKDISLLVQMTPCRILTVKEKNKVE